MATAITDAGCSFLALAINADGSNRIGNLKGSFFTSGLIEIASMAATEASCRYLDEALKKIGKKEYSMEAAVNVAKQAANEAKQICDAVQFAKSCCDSPFFSVLDMDSHSYVASANAACYQAERDAGDNNEEQCFQKAQEAIEAALYVVENSQEQINEIMKDLRLQVNKHKEVEAKTKAKLQEAKLQKAAITEAEAKLQKAAITEAEAKLQKAAVTEAEAKLQKAAITEAEAKLQEAAITEAEAKLQKAAKRVADFLSVMQNPLLSIITVSEWSGLDALKDFCKLLGPQNGWECVSHMINQAPKDTIVTAFNTRVWQLEHECFSASDKGHYLLTKLRMRANKMLLAYFSVHLPHRSDDEKQESYELLKEAIAQLCHDTPSPDLVMIGGDWNMGPDEIRQNILPDIWLAFENGSTSTPSTPYPIDNFALILPPHSRLQNMPPFDGQSIMRSLQGEWTTHAPIWAEVRLPPMRSELPDIQELSNRMARLQTGAQHPQQNH